MRYGLISPQSRIEGNEIMVTRRALDITALYMRSSAAGEVKGGKTCQRL